MNILGMSLFCLSMSISPGPVNITTLSSGLNSGFRKTLPFVSGATIGFSILLFSIGVGASALFQNVSYSYQILKYFGVVYISYIGIKTMLTSSKIETKDIKRSGFHHGFLMQWLNPKAWIACISGVSIFQIDNSMNALLIFVELYFAICYLSISFWAFVGSKMTILLKKKDTIRAINILLGIILIGLAIYILVSPYASN